MHKLIDNLPLNHFNQTSFKTYILHRNSYLTKISSCQQRKPSLHSIRFQCLLLFVVKILRPRNQALIF